MIKGIDGTIGHESEESKLSKISNISAIQASRDTSASSFVSSVAIICSFAYEKYVHTSFLESSTSLSVLDRKKVATSARSKSIGIVLDEDAVEDNPEVRGLLHDSRRKRFLDQIGGVIEPMDASKTNLLIVEAFSETFAGRGIHFD